MFFIETPRLKIIPLAKEQLFLCRITRGLMEESLGLNITSMETTPKEMSEALEDMISSCLNDSKNWNWHTNWEIVLKSENRIIGGIAFYGPPNPDICEIGYIIQDSYRKKGFASESIIAISNWAFSNGAKKIKADTEESNEASKKTLLKCGFTLKSIKNNIISFEK